MFVETTERLWRYSNITILRVANYIFLHIFQDYVIKYGKTNIASREDFIQYFIWLNNRKFPQAPTECKNIFINLSFLQSVGF